MIYIELSQNIEFKRYVAYPNKKIIIYKENSNEFIEERY